MNVADKYKAWEADLIREDVQSRVFPYSCFMFNWSGDMNMASAIRSGNGFGCKEFFYFGKKNWDRRGAVGTQNYSKISFVKYFEDFIKMKDRYHFVGIDNNHQFNCIPVQNFEWEPKDNKELLLIFGEEAAGLSKEVLDLCDDIVYVPMFGSVRSFNVASCASIIMFDLVNKKFMKDVPI